jgi:hypothetical protein
LPVISPGKSKVGGIDSDDVSSVKIEVEEKLTESLAVNLQSPVPQYLRVIFL